MKTLFHRFQNSDELRHFIFLAGGPEKNTEIKKDPGDEKEKSEVSIEDVQEMIISKDEMDNFSGQMEGLLFEEDDLGEELKPTKEVELGGQNYEVRTFVKEDQVGDTKTTVTSKLYAGEDGTSIIKKTTETVIAPEVEVQSFNMNESFKVNEAEFKNPDAVKGEMKKIFVKYGEILKSLKTVAEKKDYMKNSPITIQLASSPEFGGRDSYTKARDHNLDLAQKRKEEITALINEMGPNYMQAVQVLIPEDGMNFPEETRLALDNAKTDQEKDVIYTEALKGMTNSQLADLRMAEASFVLSTDPKVETNTEIGFDFDHPTKTLIGEACVVVLDHSHTMDTDRTELENLIKSNYPDKRKYKLDMSLDASGMGDRKEEHLKSVEKMVAEQPNAINGGPNKIVVFTDEPDFSTQGNAQEYQKRVNAVLEDAKQKGLEIVYVVRNPNNNGTEKHITLTSENAMKFFDDRPALVKPVKGGEDLPTQLADNTKDWYNDEFADFVEVQSVSSLKKKLKIVKEDKAKEVSNDLEGIELASR